MEAGAPYTEWTVEKAERFLSLVAETANVTEACRQAGLSRQTVYAVRKRDEEFATAWDAAVELGTRSLEDEAIRRARDGYDEPVWYQGQQCGVQRKFSDTLLIFLLKARDPKYRETSNVNVNNSGTTASVTLETDDPVEAARMYQELIKGRS